MLETQTWGEGEGGINGESSMETYTLAHIKQIVGMKLDQPWFVMNLKICFIIKEQFR